MVWRFLRVLRVRSCWRTQWDIFMPSTPPAQESPCDLVVLFSIRFHGTRGLLDDSCRLHCSWSTRIGMGPVTNPIGDLCEGHWWLSLVQCTIPISNSSTCYQFSCLVRLLLQVHSVGYVPPSPRMVAGVLHLQYSLAASCFYLASVVDLAIFILCCGLDFFRLLLYYLGVVFDHPCASVDCMSQFSATCVSTMPGLNVKSAAPTWYFHLLLMDWIGEGPLPYDSSAFSYRQARRRGPGRLLHQ